MDPKVITIGLAVYEQLMKDSALLDALQKAGVDNWDGYSDAIHSLNERHTKVVPWKKERVDERVDDQVWG